MNTRERTRRPGTDLKAWVAVSAALLAAWAPLAQAADPSPSPAPGSNSVAKLAQSLPSDVADGSSVMDWTDAETSTLHIVSPSLAKQGLPSEFTMAAQPAQRTMEVANEIDKAWATFQDKSRWLIEWNINAALLPPPIPPSLPHDHYATSCIAPIGELTNELHKALYGASNIEEWKQPSPLVNFTRDGMWANWKKPDGLDLDPRGDRVGLKWYGAPVDLFQPRLTDYNEICQDVTFRTPMEGLYPIVPIDAYGMKISTPFGVKEMQFNQDEIKTRIEDSCPKIEEYYTEYSDRVKAATQRIPGGLSWITAKDMLTGMPIDQIIRQQSIPFLTTYTVGVSAFDTTDAEGKKENEVGIGKATAKAIELATKTKDPLAIAYMMGAKTPVEGTDHPAPGSMQIEELKRGLPVSNMLEYQKLGYASMFQTYLNLDMVHEPKMMTLHTMSITCTIWGCSPDPYGIPVPVRNTFIGGIGGKVGCITMADVSWPPTLNLGQVFYVLPRYHYQWISVPEGYVIPHTNEMPLGMPSFIEDMRKQMGGQ